MNPCSLNLIGVLLALLLGSSLGAGENVKIKGFYNFLPYEKLTDKILNEKRFQIANATELKIEQFSITTPDILIQHLNNNTAIESFYLNDVTFGSVVENGSKLYLPFIKTFNIFVRNIELKESEKDFGMLRRYLLVEKQFGKYYEFTVQLGSKVFVTYWDLGFGDDDEGSYCEFRYFPASLPSNEFKCKDISISKHSIDLTTLPPSLERLHLHDVDIYETTLNGTRRNQLTYLHDILNSLPGLTELTINYFNPSNYQIVFDLSYFKRGLDYLFLSYVKVVRTKTLEKKDIVVISNFKCEHCQFEITNYANLIISTRKIELRNNYYKNYEFQEFISSVRNVENLYLNENYNFNVDWLNETMDSLEELTLANIKYQQPKLPLIFPGVYSLTLLNVKVVQFETILQHGFPNLERVWTTDTNQDLLRIFSANEKLSKITLCFPEISLNGADTTLEPRDLNYMTYERKDNSWITSDEDSDLAIGFRGILYKVQLYIELYMWAIFIISSFGLLGNVLIIIVYMKQKPRTSTSYIILSLAFHDSLLLILTQLSLVYFQIKLLMDGTPAQTQWWEGKKEGSLRNLIVNPRGFKVIWWHLKLTVNYLNWLFDIQSKFIYPLSKAAYFGSIYTTVLLTFERYAAICFPFRVKEYFNFKSILKYIIIFGILSIFLLAIKGFESFYSNEFFKLWQTSCGSVYVWERSTSSQNPLNYRLYRLLFQGIFWNLVLYFIPIPLLLTLNYKIWSAIRRSASFRAHTTCDQATVQITTMLVCVSLVFVVCNSISGAIVWYHVVNGADHLADVEIYSCLPLVVNSSVNFVIYSVLGKNFRDEFVKLWVQLSDRIRKSVSCQVVEERRQQQQRVIGSNNIGGNPELRLERR